MATILLVIIYIASISLGLPDSLLGAAWPSMYQDLEGSLSWAGTISMLISAGTIVSILYSHRLIKKFGTGKVTVASVAMTAMALMGFSMSRDFWNLCLWAIPYGLGAGCVDVALNSYVALHYKSRHMSWLHCLWGVGAAIGPLIMGKCLMAGLNWTGGYQITGILQVALTTVLFCVLSFWEKNSQVLEKEKKKGYHMGLREILNVAGLKAVMTCFFCYGALEITAGLWAASYMVMVKRIDAQTAAYWTSLFYLGIMLGRFLVGFAADWVSDKNMIRIGQVLALGGIVCLILPRYRAFWMEGLILVGMGLAPIYPSLLHGIPQQFGEENVQQIMGIQMVCSYGGSILMPPLLGVLAEHFSMRLLPRYLLILLLMMIFMSEWGNHLMKRQKRN